ncbi:MULTISPECIES: SpoIID/LytB domain-containing protein [Brevibacillus]|jgi:stage II sporulation protein D|uniref:SpoIID/LytB domain-containing protein n=1 Tax=Brevibacillus TaxID=55080 RepID=UPI000E36ECF6|nr:MULTISPECIES: SpoIID/LytB domain-containing protein [Brevibacillus]MBR8660620.1 SpoIID/LytB domain-containing protein [Brevibacillus sp. NL20B1]MDT3414401.1 stage II sporulation protein D [Brevibacillus aydinogluensis]NNV02585.1 SpoIID/LytB domain-containing protein [Brevibacillus sp. MCWH]REK64530.1 MAG: sporulation protein SpoIID [Brevibacillus sp.]
MCKRWMGKILTAGLLSATLLTGQVPVEAADSNIRVALFIDTGQGYRGVVPAVTLTSGTGLEVTLSGSEGAVKLPALGGNAARFRTDEYHLLVTETSDLNRAQQVAQQLSQRKWDASIQAVQRGGQTLYQVVSGTYDTYQAAAAQAQTVAQATGQQSAVKGPMRLEAGRFGSWQQALDAQQALAGAGLPAYPVLVADNGKLEYAVWIGDEVSQDAVQSLAQKAAAARPGYSYRAAASRAYAVLKKDVYGSETIWKYAFSPQARLIVEPKKGGALPLIGVEERDQRKYRGKIELSEYNGHLTVVNELPLEQYLYGVVGSEMAAGWPLEALKTQAVLARTRAISQGNKYGVANVSDTVYEQAYYGYGRESADIRQAVDETAGEVIRYRGKLVESLYYSNAGGMTADGTEAWGNPVPYLRPVPSEDRGPLETANRWYYVALTDGTLGYVRSDLIRLNGGVNPVGLKQAVIATEGTNLRSGPSTTYHRVLTTLPAGTQVTIIREEAEENAYAWTRGPFTGQEVAAMVNASQDRNKAQRVGETVESLVVTERGPSGRVLEMEANGVTLKVSSPDAHRSIFTQGGGSLRSTKFDVEEMGTFTVLGADGKRREYTRGGSVAVLGADGWESPSANGYSDQFLIYSGDGDWRTLSKQPMFLFRGYGFGHGLGVSQYGAKAMAENGYDYKQILQHYYQDVTIER